jgi:hypothetical protein
LQTCRSRFVAPEMLQWGLTGGKPGGVTARREGWQKVTPTPLFELCGSPIHRALLMHPVGILIQYALTVRLIFHGHGCAIGGDTKCGRCPKSATGSELKSFRRVRASVRLAKLRPADRTTHSVTYPSPRRDKGKVHFAGQLVFAAAGEIRALGVSAFAGAHDKFRPGPAIRC